MKNNEQVATSNARLSETQIGREMIKNLKERIYERMLDHYTNFGDVDGAESSYKVDGWDIRMNTERYPDGDGYSMDVVLTRPEWMVADLRSFNYPADTTLRKDRESSPLFWMKKFAFSFAYYIHLCTTKEIAQGEMEPIIQL